MKNCLIIIIEEQYVFDNDWYLDTLKEKCVYLVREQLAILQLCS